VVLKVDSPPRLSDSEFQRASFVFFFPSDSSHEFSLVAEADPPPSLVITGKA